MKLLSQWLLVTAFFIVGSVISVKFFDCSISTSTTLCFGYAVGYGYALLYNRKNIKEDKKC